MPYHGDDYYEPDEWDERVDMFADPGGHSALRRASEENPRDQRCPNCGEPNVLTREDRRLGYQCDRCADRSELGLDP